MVGMLVVEADNVLSALASVTLDTDEFLGVDVVAIVRRIVASVAGARDAGYGFGTVVRKSAEQHAAALVWVGFFAVLAERSVDVAGNSEHCANAEVRSQIAEVKVEIGSLLSCHEFSLLQSYFLLLQSGLHPSFQNL